MSNISPILLAVLLVILSQLSEQRTCTRSSVRYVSTSAAGYYSEPYSQNYKCGFWGWSRCTRTRYRSKSRTVYSQRSTYYTSCCAGYSGSRCQAVCSPSCLNGGTCTSPNTCSCRNGWTGSRCNNPTCSPSCRNGGSCIAPNRCSCSRGWTGSLCTQPVCSPSCRNGGTCSAPNTCLCRNGWNGRSCSNDVNECRNQNGGCHHVCHNTAGSFECRCRSGFSLASDGKTCNEPPTVPRNVRVSNVGKRTATVNWEPPSISFSNSLTSVSSYRITASQSDFQTGNRVATKSRQSRSHQFTNLEEFTTYTFVVAASNTFGEGESSRPQEATTLSSAPSAAPLQVDVTANSPYNITITWTPPPEIDRNGIILYYKIRVRESETETNFQWTSSELISTHDLLHPFYHYECRVAAHNLAGTGPFSTAESVQTMPAVPTAAPMQIRVYNSTSSSLSLTWKPPPPADRNGNITLYHLIVTEQETDESFYFTVSSQNYTLLNLHPFYTYNTSIAAETVGVGPYSVSLIQQTMESVPSSAPGGFSMAIINSTSLALAWSELAPADRNGIIREYIINLSDMKNTNTTTYRTSKTNYTIINLHPDYTYSGKVTASTVIGGGPFTSLLEVKLPEAAPSGSPTNFSLADLHARSMVLWWELPLESQRNGVITGYTLHIIELVSHNVIVIDTENTTVLVSEIYPVKSYMCKVAAYTTVGVGPYSETVIVQTPEDVPSPVRVTNMRFVPGRPNELSLNWTPPIELNGDLLAYTVYCKTSPYQPLCGCDTATVVQNVVSCFCDFPFNSSYNEQAVLAVSLSYTAIVGGFLPYTNYTCFMTANTTAGESNPSQPVSAITDESVPDDPPQNVTVIAINSTAIQICWEQPFSPNGVIISYSVVYNITLREDNDITLSTNSTAVNITGLNEYTVYRFLLFASTRIGDGPSTLVLGRTNESYPHSPPRHVEMFNIGQRCAHLSWIPPVFQDQNGPLSYYEIQFLQTQFDTIPTIVVHTTNLSISCCGLEEYTNYSVTVAAATNSGLGPFSSPVSLLTHEDAPSSPPLFGQGYAQSSSIITFNWTAPLAVDQNGVIRHYSVIVSEVPTGRKWFLVAIQPQITLASLHPYYNYSCIVAAYTTEVGPFSEPFCVLTEEEAPTSPPSMPRVVALSSTSVTLEWEPPPSEHQNGIIRFYSVCYLEEETTLEFLSTSNSTTLTIMDLHPYFTYYIRVRAETVSPGPFSGLQRVQLEEDAPSSSVRNVSVESLNSRTMLITWDPPAFTHLNGLIRNYIVYTIEAETSDVLNFTLSTATYITVGQLHPYYTYSIMVTPVTVKPGPLSSPVYITMPEDVPSGSVQDVEIEQLYSRKLNLRWEPPDTEDRNGNITYYQAVITLVGSNSSTQTVLFPNTSGELSNLTPYSTYKIEIAASTAIGIGPFSSPIIVQTKEDAPNSPPLHVHAIATNSHTATVSWSPPLPEDINGVIRGYTVTLLETDTSQEFLLSTNTMTITLSILHPAYTYIYQVAANTVTLGPASQEMNLTMPEDVPSGPPYNISAVVVESDSVYLQWTAPNKSAMNGIITGYIVHYAAFESNNITTMVVNDPLVNIINLRPHSLYTFSVAATTAVGIGPFSTHFHIRTAETAPLSSPENLTATVMDSTTVVINWISPPISAHNGIIRYYILNLTELDTGTHISVQSETTTKIFPSLHPYYTYRIAVTAVTIASGPFSSPITFALPEEAPSGPPSDFDIMALSSDSLQISWNPPLLEERNGVITHYVVTVTNLDEGQSLQQIIVFNTSLLLSPLDPHTEYEVFVSAATSAGSGPPTYPLSAHTHEDAPTQGPSNLSIVDIGPTHITIQWDHPPNDTHQGIIRQYHIYIDVEETNTTLFYSTSSNTTELYLSSLHPYYTYHMKVAAVTVEEGSSSNLSARTNESAPVGPPQNLQVHILTPRSFNITWYNVLNEERNGIIRQYIISISKSGIQSQLFTVSAQLLYHVVWGLSPYTNYTINIAAISVDRGPYSNEVRVETPEAAPELPPRNMIVNILNSRQLAISWIPPKRNYINGNIREYLINIILVDNNSTRSMRSKESDVIIDVLPFRHYLVSVAVVTVENGPFSEGIGVEMPEDAPTASPQNLQVINITSTTVMLTWEQPDDEFHNGIIRQYLIIAQPLMVDLESIRRTATEKSLEIDGLHPFTSYALSVAAFTVDLGPSSENISFMTMESIPTGPPLSVDVNSINSTAINITWNPPILLHTNGIILNYVIEVTLTTYETVTTAHRETSEYNNKFVGGLKPHSIYGVSVAVENSIGIGPFSSSTLVQTMEDAPGAPQDLAVSNLTSTSATICWNSPAVHNGIIRAYEIELVENTTGVVNYFTYPDTKYMFENLHPYYQYVIQVKAVTVLAGDFSTELEFTTLQDVPSGSPQNIFVDVLNSTHALISWDKPNSEKQNGDIVGFHIRVFETYSQDVYPELIVSSVFVTLPDLHPYYTYDTQIAAATSVGVGPFSSVYSFTMPEAAPSSPPQNVTGIPISSTSILISWKPPDLPNQNGQIRSYNIEIIDSIIRTERILNISSEHNQLLVDMLHPHRMYYTRVAATTIDSGVLSQTVEITTKEDIPSEGPSGVRGWSTNSTSITVTWRELPEDLRNGVIQFYSVKIIEIITGRVITAEKNSTEADISSLHPYYLYEVAVAATTQIGTGPFSTGNLVRTYSDVPTGPPVDVEMQSISSTSVTIAWGAPQFDQQNGVIIAYHLIVSNKKENRKFTVNSTLSYISNTVVSSLKPFSHYNLSIAAVNINGTGPPSTLLPFVTAHAAPDAAPVDLRTCNVSSRTLCLSWQPPPTTSHNGIIRGYTLHITEINTKDSIDYKSESTKYTLEYLHPYYTYQISIAAVTVGIGPFANLTVTTLEEKPSGPPQELEVLSVTSSSVTISWVPPYLHQQNGVIQSYSIGICYESSCWNENSVQTQYTITSLHPFYTYHINIAAVTVDNGPATAYKSVTCLEDVPSGPPTNVSAEVRSSSILHLAWSPPEPDNQNGIIRHYTILIGNQAESLNQTFVTEEMELNVPSLNPYTVYECSVAAVTVGRGPYSMSVLVRTLQDVPAGPPLNMAVSFLSSSSIELSWSPPLTQLQNGIIQHYIVIVSSQHDNIRREVNVSNAIIEQLHPYYTYDVSVSAVTVDVGPFSDTLTFTMPQDSPSSGPQNVEALSFSPYNIEVKWEPPDVEDRNGKIISYYINVTHVISGEGQSFETAGNVLFFSENTFHPYYTYSITIHAITIDISPGTKVNITTLEAVPTTSPLNVEAETTSSSVVRLTWEPPFVEHRNGRIREYSILRVTLPSGDLQETVTNATEIFFTTLHPYTNYFFVVAAKTVSLGPYSPQVFANTPEADPSGIIQNISLTVGSPTSVGMRWLPPPIHTWNGVINNYTIFVTHIESVCNISQEVQNLSFTLSHPLEGNRLSNSRDPHHVFLPLLFETLIITDLQECQVYQFSMVVNNAAGSGPKSLPIIQELPGSDPSEAPRNIQIQLLSSTSVKVQWDPPSPIHHNGIINSYWVVLTNETNIVLNISTDKRFIFIYALEGYTDYYLEIMAENSAGKGPPSHPLHFKTPEDVPSPPVNVNVWQVGETSVSVSWSVPDQTNGVIIGYMISYAISGVDNAMEHQDKELDAQHTKININGLTIGALYLFTVRAKTVIGYGRYSENISIILVKDFLPQAGNQSLPQEDAGGLIAVSAVAAGGWMLIGIIIVIVVSVFCKRRLRQKCPRQSNNEEHEKDDQPISPTEHEESTAL